MATEWLRVMMDEVERKRREAIDARTEAQRRQAAQAPTAKSVSSATRRG